MTCDPRQSAITTHGLVCASLDIILTSSLTLLVYLVVGELNLRTITWSWKVLYLVGPLSIGEFVLVSIIDRLLKETTEMEDKVKKKDKDLQDLLKRAKRRPQWWNDYFPKDEESHGRDNSHKDSKESNDQKLLMRANGMN